MSSKCCMKRKATSELDQDSPLEYGKQSSRPSSSALSLKASMQAKTQLRPQYGAHSLARLHRGSNEDTWTTSPLPAPTGAAAAATTLPRMHMLAVFDGHSSASVSSMAAAQLPQLLTQLLQDAAAEGAADVDAVMQQVLQQAFEQLDQRVQPLDNSGSTATVAVLTPGYIHLAWVGDSRAVLMGQGGRVLAHTQEHRATREDEQERVAAAGGTILNNSGLRVMGILQCTRAIGDKDLQPYGVIPTPDVLSVPRTGQEEFLVLATDGLWDVVSNEEVYDYAVKTMDRVRDRACQTNSKGICRGCQAAGVAARALASCARKKHGSRDDITVLLAHVNAHCSCTQPASTVSSVASSSTCLAASSSHCGAANAAQAGASVASNSQQHSSPAALTSEQPLTSAKGGPRVAELPELQPHKHTPTLQDLLQPAASQPPQLPAPPQQPKQHQHIQRHWHTRSSSDVLMLQPSVCPRPSHAAAHAAAEDTVVEAEGLHTTLLSDLALSSPFAMMLGASVTEIEVEVDVVGLKVGEVHDFSMSVSSGAVSRSSAPPSIISTVASTGPSIARKRSMSMVVGNTRSCSSVGAPQIGPMGSSEQPVVV